LPFAGALLPTPANASQQLNQLALQLQLKFASPAFQQLLAEPGNAAVEQTKRQLTDMETKLAAQLLVFNQLKQQQGMEAEKEQMMQQLIAQMVMIDQQIKLFEQLKLQEVFDQARQQGQAPQQAAANPPGNQPAGKGKCWSEQQFVPSRKTRTLMAH
jgi:hypothetical protein